MNHGTEQILNSTIIELGKPDLELNMSVIEPIGRVLSTDTILIYNTEHVSAATGTDLIWN